MCGGAFVEELSILLSQPIELLLGVDRAPDEGGVLCCELPPLLMQLFDHRAELGNLLRRGGPNPFSDLMIGGQLFEDRAMVRVDRVAADPGLAR